MKNKLGEKFHKIAMEVNAKRKFKNIVKHNFCPKKFRQLKPKCSTLYKILIPRKLSLLTSLQAMKIGGNSTFRFAKGL